MELTEEGKIYMSETLGIKLDMDFRDLAQNNNLTESAIPDAHLEYFTIDGYSSAFSAAYKENYRRIFSALADERNYPVYMHCTGGADRTGTVAFLLNALLGVPEVELIHDYEFTSFSVYGERNSKTGIYAPYFKSLREGLAKYKGENLSEKAETYLLSIGITELEISNIKAIMFGESLEAAIEPQTRFNSNLDESYSISILGNMDVKSITIGGKAVEFVLEGIEFLSWQTRCLRTWLSERSTVCAPSGTRSIRLASTIKKFRLRCRKLLILMCTPACGLASLAAKRGRRSIA